MSYQTKKSSEIGVVDSAKDAFENSPETSAKSASYSDLREEIKEKFQTRSAYDLGIYIRDYWESDCCMFRLMSSAPERLESYDLRKLCNKSTILYWQTSAQTEELAKYSRLVFAALFKCWFLFYQSKPGTQFEKYLAFPFRITQDGPQTISDILKAHAYQCNNIASQLKSKKGINGVTHPIGPSQWHHYHFPPLCRAIVTLLDQNSLSPAVYDEDNNIYLDDEVRRWNVVLTLTGDQRGLSEAVNFDTIRSESLPLSRDDIDDINRTDIIRVPMKTAVHSIEKLRQREGRAWRNSGKGCVDSILESNKECISSVFDGADESGFGLVRTPSNNKWNWAVIDNTRALKRDGVLSAFKDADEYVDAVLDNPSEFRWKIDQIEEAMKQMRCGTYERCYLDSIARHWSHRWI